MKRAKISRLEHVVQGHHRLVGAGERGDLEVCFIFGLPIEFPSFVCKM